MKKVNLFLIMAFLIGFSGVAQKTNISSWGPVTKQDAFTRNPANKVQHYPNLSGSTNQKQPKFLSTESFEGAFPPSGWTKQDPDGGTGWAQCANGTTPLDGWTHGAQTVPPGGGGFVAYCTYSTGGNGANDQWLISPKFTVAPHDSVSFCLWFYGAFEDTLEIRISHTTNTMNAFTTVLDILDTNDLSPMVTWKKFSYSLAAFAGQDIYIAFREKVKDNINSGSYIALDLFRFGTSIVYHNDIAPVAILNPVSTHILTAADTVAVLVKNNDNVSHSGIPISYVIDGGAPVNANIAAVIPANGSVNYKFAQPGNFSIPGHVYNLLIYTSFPADSNIYNDTIHSIVTNHWDVAPVSDDNPPVIGPSTINPKATVINNGTLATTFNVTMQITGGYTSTKTITNLAPNATQQVTFDPWNAALGNYGITIFTTLTADSVHANDMITDSIHVITVTGFYCCVAYAGTPPAFPLGPATSYLQIPGELTSLANQTGQPFIGAATWGYGNRWFGSEYSTNKLLIIDTLTGARTVVGSMGVTITGLAYDYASGILYGVDWDGSNSHLYKINPVNGSVTLVGLSTSQLLINLACDLNGNLYSVAISDDNLYSISSATGTATLVGSIGFDANYSQDMEFDHNTEILYMAAYNASSGSGELRTVNVSTGATTMIGAFEYNAEITGMAIPYKSVIAGKDAASVSINGISTSCDLDAAEPVQMTILNYGADTMHSFNVTMKVDGGAPVTEAVTATLAPGATYNYTFIATANLSASGSHNITAYVALTGDTLTLNDTTSLTVIHVAVSGMPYSMGFEPADDFTGWKIVDANNDLYTWKLSATGGNLAPGCAYYSYNTHSSADDWLISTCIRADSGFVYRLTFYDRIVDPAYPEKLKIYMGTGNTPAALTTLLHSEMNITNTTYTQRLVDFTVPASGVYYFGWHCISDSDKYILVVDDINLSVVSSNDAASISVNGLASACDLGPAETVKFTILDYGLDTIHSLNASMIVDGNAPVTELVTATIAPGATYNYTFTATANLSAVGSHTIKTVVGLPGDTVSLNDTAHVTVNQIPVENAPYSMGFEPTESFLGWKIEDDNHDNFTWSIVSTGGHNGPYAARYSFSATAAADDWLITKCIQLDASKIYHFSYWYAAQSADYPESFMVLMGDAPVSAAMQTLIANYMSVTNVAYQMGGANFTVPADGIYYFGFHCMSAADKWYLYIDDINVTDVTGIKENDIAENISIYPNPATENINIISGSMVNKISITNTLGALVYKSSGKGNQFRISTSLFVKGMYFITLETDQGTVTRKIIVG